MKYNTKNSRILWFSLAVVLLLVLVTVCTKLENPKQPSQTDPTTQTSSSQSTAASETGSTASSTIPSTSPSTEISSFPDDTLPSLPATVPSSGLSTVPPAPNPTTPTTIPATTPVTSPATTPATQPTTPQTVPTQPTTQATAPATTATLKINTKEDTVVIIGNTLQIDYVYTGNKTLTWTSDDTSVMTVDSNGNVTAKSVGYAMIKVTDGSLVKRVTLKIEEPDTRPLATSLVEMSHNAPLYDGVTKYAGDSMTFQVYAMPEEANRLVKVSSNNSSVVSVSYTPDSRNITQVTLNFKSAGSATVTIKSADGAKSKSYTIIVKADYECNPGDGLLTPEQFVNAYNGVVKANGMSTSGMPSGYLMWTLSPSELTWAKVRNNAEIRFHAWWKIGYRTIVLTYEQITAGGSYVFYIRGY